MASETEMCRNLLILLLATIISFLLAETTTRIFLAKRIVLYPRYHTDATYGEFRIRRLRPNAKFWHTSVDGSWEFKTNAQGFRDVHDYTYAKPPGTIRVIVLGDSQTLGFEVRQGRTYSEVIENYLNRHDMKVEVLNTGVSGFSTAEELIFLENEGIRYNPDVLVLGFYANDLEDNVKADLFRLEDGHLILNGREHLPGVTILNVHNNFRLLRWLSENSYFYSALMNAIWNTAKQRLYTSKRTELVTEYAIALNKNSDYQIQLQARLIERMYTFCRNRKIELVILDIPQLQGKYINSSVPSTLEPVFVRNSDVFISSETLLGTYPDATDVFVPNGQQHISEFTHLMLGLAVSKAIQLRRVTRSRSGNDQALLLSHHDTH